MSETDNPRQKINKATDAEEVRARVSPPSQTGQLSDDVLEGITGGLVLDQSLTSTRVHFAN